MSERYTTGKPPADQLLWNNLANRLIDLDCDYRTGVPKQMDFEQFYHNLRGEEPIDDIIERIQDES